VLFYFPNRELLRCDLLFFSGTWVGDFLGGKGIERCFTLVTLGILGGCNKFLQTKYSVSILSMQALLSCPG